MESTMNAIPDDDNIKMPGTVPVEDRFFEGPESSAEDEPSFQMTAPLEAHTRGNAWVENPDDNIKVPGTVSVEG